MKIDNIKQLEAVIKLCRRQGIESISIDGVSLKLGDAPVKAKANSESTAPIDETPQPTEEELMFWSSQ